MFKGLDPGERSAFFKQAELQAYPAGSMIFTPEDSSTERLFILKEGRVDRYRLTPSGKRLVTRRIAPGEVFGVMGLLGRTMQGNFAEAAVDSVVYLLTRDRVLALLRRQPDFALRVLDNLGNRVRQLEERLVETAYSPAVVRLARFLLDNADPLSGSLPAITHEQIGNTIGAVRQTVTEILGTMRRRGIIVTTGRQIRIVDRKGLESIAGEEERQSAS